MTSTGTSAGTVTLSLAPASSTIPVGQVVNINLQVAAGSQSVDGVAAYLNFDPTVFQVVDSSGNPTTTIDDPGTPLNVELLNNVDNTNGQIDYAVGTLGSSPPTGTFTVGTIHLKAIAPSSGSNLSFAFDAANNRITNVTLKGVSVLGNATGGNYAVVSTIINASVGLQRPNATPPDPSYAEPLTVNFLAPGSTAVAFVATPTTDENAHFTISGVAPGTYDVEVKNSHTLGLMQPNVTINSGVNTLTLGTLLEGDANNDNQVNITDFSILAAAFQTSAGQSSYDPRADFDNSGQVNITDFSLLAGNFGKFGDQTDTSAPLTARRALTTSGVTMSLVPGATDAAPGSIVTLAIQVAAGTQPIDGAAAYINFDPSVFQAVDSSGNPTATIDDPGTPLNVELFNSVDNTNGQINYAVGTLASSLPTGTFTIGTMHLKVVGTIPSSGSTISFVSDSAGNRETNVTSKGMSVLGNAQNATISAASPSATATATNTPTATVTPSATTTPSLSPTSTPTSTVTMTTTVPTSTPIATATVISTIAPTPGATQVITLPNNQGDIIVPGDDAGTSVLQATARIIAPPTDIPSGLTALAAVQIQFTNTANGDIVHQFAQPVTIEISYAGFGLSQTQINHLTIYNASENQFLPTTIDTSRQIAIAQTRQFSTFALAQVTSPVPMVYLPAVSDNTSSGW